MDEDPIMQELREIRRQLMAEAGGDLGKFIERARRDAPRLLASVRETAAHSAKPRPAKAKARKKPSFRSAHRKPAGP